MRVLQLIDSLEAGGAERVAVNYANGLLNRIDGSYLCVTRAEGLLKSSVNNAVGYLFLNKKATIGDLEVISFYKKRRYNSNTRTFVVLFFSYADYYFKS